MPYVRQEARAMIHPRSTVKALGPGELNYQITRLCWEYIKDVGVTYSRLNEVIGALECAKLELYRKVAAKYEDQKCTENGEVYT